jgi:hypothetical protein
MWVGMHEWGVRHPRLANVCRRHACRRPPLPSLTLSAVKEREDAVELLSGPQGGDGAQESPSTAAMPIIVATFLGWKCDVRWGRRNEVTRSTFAVNIYGSQKSGALKKIRSQWMQSTLIKVEPTTIDIYIIRNISVYWLVCAFEWA